MLNVRSNAIEPPRTIVARIRKVLAGMVAKMKLHSLGEAAKIVRAEVAGV